MAEKLLNRLVEIQVFQVGEFILKSGAISPIYIDLRRTIAEPGLIKDIADEIYRKQCGSCVTADVVCGVPYTALPMASIYSVDRNVPMIMKRKEAKDHGTKKMVEGVFQKGAKCLIIEDIVTSGTSVIETAEVLRKEGLVVTDCIVILNRLQGGEENLTKSGIKLHSLLTVSDLFQRYCTVNKVDPLLVKSVKQYLKNNQYIPVKKQPTRSLLSFGERANKTRQPVMKRLFEIMDTKETNLCVAADSLHSKELLELAVKLGPHICALKTHIDILKDFTDDVPGKLKAVAKQHNFLIFEDRKFADIGNTVVNQYANGIYKIQDWADIVTVHSLPGSGIIDALKSASKDKERACILIAEMSSKGALTDSDYKRKTAEMAEKYSDYVIGFVAQESISDNLSLIQMSPGVNISTAGDFLGQQYKSPEEAISNGADIVIVGRGICCSDNIVEAAVMYKSRSYLAYKQKCI